MSPLDERLEYRQALADRLADLARGDDPDRRRGRRRTGLVAARHAVRSGPTSSRPCTRRSAESHPGARIAPRPAATAGSEHLSAVALVAELDAFVLVAVRRPARSTTPPGSRPPGRSCTPTSCSTPSVSSSPPRRSWRSWSTGATSWRPSRRRPASSGPPRQSRPPAAVGVALSKFLDATISPFGRLARTFVEGQALDPRALAVDVSADAVRTVEGSAKGFKTEGKRPGYERVKRHQASITRLVEEALNRPDVDVAADPGRRGLDGPEDVPRTA